MISKAYSLKGDSHWAF